MCDENNGICLMRWQYKWHRLILTLPRKTFDELYALASPSCPHPSDCQLIYHTLSGPAAASAGHCRIIPSKSTQSHLHTGRGIVQLAKHGKCCPLTPQVIASFLNISYLFTSCSHPKRLSWIQIWGVLCSLQLKLLYPFTVYFKWRINSMGIWPRLVQITIQLVKTGPFSYVI